MEIWLGAAIGLLLGWGASRTHPSVDAGGIVGALAGIIGGLMGQAWLGPVLAPSLADQALAGAAAGGAIGALVFAPLAGVAVLELRRRLRDRAGAGSDDRG
ncbi:hypothetical protein ACNI3K_02830 [Demequina sp. SO4-13]|uniref:hypothetical protein n=1 Tax=Demequina sp. SO4-13 TaxID=3401027 RepID=UPI003AF8AE53